MKTTTLLIVLTILSTLCFASSEPDQADTPNCLKGLTALGVKIAELPDDALSCGVRSEELLALTKELLEKSGLKVLDASELEKTPGKPYLNIDLSLIMDSGRKACAIDLRLSVRQMVKQTRDETIEPIDSATWNNYGLSLALPGQARDGIRLRLAHSISFLIEDWCKANGKPLPNTKKKSSV